MAMGSRSQSARTYLERHLDEFFNCDKDELIKHGLRALRDTLPNEVELTSKVNYFEISLAISGSRLFSFDSRGPPLQGLWKHSWSFIVISSRELLCAWEAGGTMIEISVSDGNLKQVLMRNYLEHGLEL